MQRAQACTKNISAREKGIYMTMATNNISVIFANMHKACASMYEEMYKYNVSLRQQMHEKCINVNIVIYSVVIIVSSLSPVT